MQSLSYSDYQIEEFIIQKKIDNLFLAQNEMKMTLNSPSQFKPEINKDLLDRVEFTLLEHTRALINIGNHKEGQRDAISCFQAFERPRKEEAAKAIMLSGEVLEDAGDLNQAVIYYKKAFNIFTKAPNHREQAKESLIRTMQKMSQTSSPQDAILAHRYIYEEELHKIDKDNELVEKAKTGFTVGCKKLIGEGKLEEVYNHIREMNKVGSEAFSSDRNKLLAENANLVPIANSIAIESAKNGSDKETKKYLGFAAGLTSFSASTHPQVIRTHIEVARIARESGNEDLANEVLEKGMARTPLANNPNASKHLGANHEIRQATLEAVKGIAKNKPSQAISMARLISSRLPTGKHKLSPDKILNAAQTKRSLPLVNKAIEVIQEIQAATKPQECGLKPEN